MKSSEIEGEHLDREQVRSSIGHRLGIGIGALTPADCNVGGVVEMMFDATQKFAKSLTDERLFACSPVRLARSALPYRTQQYEQDCRRRLAR